MVQFVHPVGVREGAAGLVPQDGAVLPVLPQTSHHLQELIGLVVTLVVAEMALETEVLGLGVVDRGDNVPSGPPRRQMIQGSEQAGHMVGGVVGGGVGGAEPDVLGGGRDHGQGEADVELHATRPGAHRLGHGVTEDAGHG